MLLGVSSIPRVAKADVDSEDVATYAVQRRLFKIGLELNVGAGFLPMNAFSKGFMLEGDVAYHFSNAVAWEIVQGGYVLANVNTSLEKELQENFAVQPTQISRAQYLVSSNLLFTPFYGKLAGFNRSVNHIELFFPVGVALSRYENPGEFREGIDLGVGLRWFLGTHTSLRLEARDYMLTPGFSHFNLTNELLFTLGLSVGFGGDDR
jgi:outer membrane beta-barrel protein